LEAIASPLRDGPGAVVLLFDLACDLPPVLADPAQVREVVTSLVRNAAEAIGSDNGVVTVQTGVRQDNSCEQVFVSVSDTGPGLPEAIRDSLFQPYASTKSLGRGLGLSAALGIVHRHAGDMEVRSYPGAGATFTVLLPATGSAAPCAADRVAAVPASAPAAS
jgi:signal transduction histidine kinase